MCFVVFHSSQDYLEIETRDLDHPISYRCKKHRQTVTSLEAEKNGLVTSSFALFPQCLAVGGLLEAAACCWGKDGIASTMVGASLLSGKPEETACMRIDHTVEAATDDGGEGEDDVMECNKYHGPLHELQGR
jgi:hypothetical protein